MNASRLGSTRQAYHRFEHSALGITPLQRWQRDTEACVNCLRPPTCVASSFIASTALSAAILLSCFSSDSMKP